MGVVVSLGNFVVEIYFTTKAGEGGGGVMDFHELFDDVLT